MFGSLPYLSIHPRFAASHVHVQVDVVLLPEDVLLVAYNDNAESLRDTLALASSGDGGHTWVQRALLETNPFGSFHYPTLLYDSVQVRQGIPQNIKV